MTLLAALPPPSRPLRPLSSPSLSPVIRDLIRLPPTVLELALESLTCIQLSRDGTRRSSLSFQDIRYLCSEHEAALRISAPHFFGQGQNDPLLWKKGGTYSDLLDLYKARGISTPVLWTELPAGSEKEATKVWRRGGLHGIQVNRSNFKRVETWINGHDEQERATLIKFFVHGQAALLEKLSKGEFDILGPQLEIPRSHGMLLTPSGLHAQCVLPIHAQQEKKYPNDTGIVTVKSKTESWGRSLPVSRETFTALKGFLHEEDPMRALLSVGIVEKSMHPQIVAYQEGSGKTGHFTRFTVVAPAGDQRERHQITYRVTVSPSGRAGIEVNK